MLPGRPAFIARPGLLQGVQIQAAVVGALMLRELQSRYGRRGLGFLWLFLEPAVLGVLIGTARWLRDRTLPAGMNMIAFVVIGYTVYYLYRTLVSRAASAYESNQELLAHARVSLEDVLMARTILETAAVMMAVAVFVIFLGIYTGD
jgi:capsular polysaccharide transport system permease protein